MARQNTSHIDDPAALGRRLRTTRLERGLTQSALVFEGCTIGHVSRIEAGLRTPSLQVVRRLAEILEVDERWLATGTSTPPEPVEETILRDARIATRLGEIAEATAALDVLGPEDALTDAIRARVLAARGQIAFADDRTRDAIELLEKAFATDPALDDPDAAEALGRALARIERLAEAAEILGAWLARAERDDDPALRLRFGVLLANAQADADDPTAAAETLRRIGDDVAAGDPIALARIYWTRSRVHTRAGETREAVDLARRTLEMLSTSDSQIQRARAHLLLAYTQLAASSPEEALRHVGNARALLGSSLGNRHDRMLLLIEEARALVLLGRAAEATGPAMEAVGILPEDASRVDIGRAYTELASAFASAGDLERAREIFELALDMVAGGPGRYAADVRRRFAELLERLGDADRASALRAEHGA